MVGCRDRFKVTDNGILNIENRVPHSSTITDLFNYELAGFIHGNW